jgi:precorrin-2 methylase
MNQGATAANSPLPTWRELYKAALFETNRDKLPERIADAEKAIIARARELFASTTDTIEEDQALDDALYAMRALQSCVSRQTAAA